MLKLTALFLLFLSLGYSLSLERRVLANSIRAPPSSASLGPTRHAINIAPLRSTVQSRSHITLSTNLILPDAVPEPLIITHSGNFHADEALAVFMLSKIFPKYRLQRTREKAEIAKGDIVVDVGGEYQPEKGRFDHHQSTFSETFSDKHLVTRMSSAGLVYKHYGKLVIESMYQNLDQNTLNFVHEKVYGDFIEGVDAMDNGVPQIQGKQMYKTPTLNGRIARLRPYWNQLPKDNDELFQEAMKIMGDEFIYVVDELVNSYIPAKLEVEKAIKERYNVDPSGKIIKLAQPCPWKAHLTSLERELKTENILYVLFQDVDSWRAQAVESAKFKCRLPFPGSWRGTEGDELRNHSGVADAKFVHASGFMAGAASFEGALELARKSIQEEHVEESVDRKE